MKRYFYLLFILLSMGLNSCLESGLEELPVFDEADITNFNFEVRWKDATTGDFRVIRLQNTPTIDADNQTVTNSVLIPDAGSNFPENIRNSVSLTTLVAYCDLSTAATIAPVQGAPKLGVPGDFSGSVNYLVTAADGKTTKEWTITTTIANP